MEVVPLNSREMDLFVLGVPSSPKTWFVRVQVFGNPVVVPDAAPL
jgi:hypothetical protein